MKRKLVPNGPLIHPSSFIPHPSDQSLPLAVLTGGDGFVENIQGDVDVFFCQDERRRPTDDAFAAAEYDKAAVEAFHLDLIAEFRSRFQRCFVFNKFDAEHKAESTNVADDIVFVLDLVQAFLKISTYGCRIFD